MNQLEDNKKSTHLERTSHIERQKDKISAKIISITNVTPTIKTFLFHSSSSLHFFPGQWLDVFISSISIVGGFSITSTPQLYSNTNTFELAIKNSNHPPAKWFHEIARIGDMVQVRVGGNFVWNEEIEYQQGIERIIFIAGGVGINPLMSMLESILKKNEKEYDIDEIKNYVDDNNNHHEMTIRKIRLLYSAKSFDELLFYDRIENLRKKSSNILECKYFLTRDYRSPSSSSSPPSDIISAGKKFYYQKRIDQEILNKIIEIEQNNLTKLKCFVCGPPEMEDDIIKWWKEVGVDEKRISYEKWW
ncbi:hypothetical protein Glove_279g13 [Diversispora epigaea]|uniref:Oxidoreductase NAD-binding domain-containing protein 1 n=1 Tax=Diversispora epigaea TaxID=1348612 RepID=A0A397I467_9GLOM|nr:hypothetical protein Glove_279g13 [Diversispora epigaea]